MNSYDNYLENERELYESRQQFGSDPEDTGFVIWSRETAIEPYLEYSTNNEAEAYNAFEATIKDYSVSGVPRIIELTTVEAYALFRGVKYTECETIKEHKII